MRAVIPTAFPSWTEPPSPRVDRDGDAQGAGEGLEAGLDHVVGVGAVANRDVQGQFGAVGDGAEELLGQLGVEAGDRGGGQVGVEDAVRPARDVDRALRQRLVHRHHGRAVAPDPGAVAERLVERLPEHDADVLHGVVGAGLQIAVRLDLQAQPPVAGKQVEHVVEEADAGRGARLPPVEVEREPDLGLGGAAIACGGAAHDLLLIIADSPWTGNPSAWASVFTCGASFAAARAETSTVAAERRKTPGLSGPEKRPAPPVGRM